MLSCSLQKSLIVCLVSLWLLGPLPSAAQGGPLLDWLRQKNKRNDDINVGGLQATSGTLTQAGTSLQPGQCQSTCMQTCQRVSVNYVPYTAYRTNWQRVPVTQYRPVTNTDPRTGCVVTCMKPCTDYSWQLQRVPYTTYRPVYRTYNYQVPVTTITNDCDNGGCATCGVAGSPAIVPGTIDPNAFPGGTVVPGAGGFVPSGAGATIVPADGIPTLSSNGRPIYQELPPAYSNNGLMPNNMYQGNLYGGAISGNYPVPQSYQAYQPSANGQTGMIQGNNGSISGNQVNAYYPNTNYSGVDAYSGISTYSGYGQSNNPMIGNGTYNEGYTAPMPSSFEAPMPGVSRDGGLGAGGAGATSPADQTPILQDTTSFNGQMQNRSNLPSVMSDSEMNAQPMQDPSPALRWDFNAPQLARPEDQSAHADVQVQWAYNPVRLASFSDATESAPTAFGAASFSQQNSADTQSPNEQWSSGNDGQGNVANSQWK